MFPSLNFQCYSDIRMPSKPDLPLRLIRITCTFPAGLYSIRSICFTPFTFFLVLQSKNASPGLAHISHSPYLSSILQRNSSVNSFSPETTRKITSMVVQHNLTAMNSNRMLGITISAQIKARTIFLPRPASPCWLRQTSPTRVLFLCFIKRPIHTHKIQNRNSLWTVPVFYI